MDISKSTLNHSSNHPEARQVLLEAQVTRLSNRDRDAFLAALDAADAKPNKALKAAARRYKKERRERL